MKKFKYCACLLIIALISTSTVVMGGEKNKTLKAYKTQITDAEPESLQVFSYGQGNFIIISQQRPQPKIFKLDGNTGSVLPLDVSIPTCSFYHLEANLLYGFRQVFGPAPKTEMYVLNLRGKSLTQYNLEGILIHPDQFAITNKHLVYCDPHDQTKIIQRMIKPKGKLGFPISSSVVSASIGSLKSNPSGSLLFVSDPDKDRLLEFTIAADGPESNVVVSAPAPQGCFSFLNDTTIIDRSGNIFMKEEQSFIQKFSTNTQEGVPVACVNSDFLIVSTSPHSLTYFSVATPNNAVGGSEFEEEILAVCASKDNLVALLQSSDGKFFAAQLKLQAQSQSFLERDVDIESELSEQVLAEEQAVSPADSTIQSECYNVENHEGLHIIYIPGGTPLAEIKKDLRYSEAYQLRFNNAKGATIKSGKVGTGSTINLVQGEKICYTLTVVMPGDVTGTGTTTKKDVSAIYKHLFGEEQLEGPFLLAADLNKDTRVDSLDLLAVYKKQIQKSPK